MGVFVVFLGVVYYYVLVFVFIDDMWGFGVVLVYVGLLELEKEGVGMGLVMLVVLNSWWWVIGLKCRVWYRLLSSFGLVGWCSRLGLLFFNGVFSVMVVSWC